jgi:hypothetical protein
MKKERNVRQEFAVFLRTRRTRDKRKEETEWKEEEYADHLQSSSSGIPITSFRHIFF